MAVVMFIDDDQDTLATLSKAATMFGHQVLVASTAEDALSQALQHRPDVIFLDVHLRGSNSLVALAKLRYQPSLRDVPVYLMSATPEMRVETLLPRLPVQGFLLKPIRLQTLIEVIDVNVRNRPPYHRGHARGSDG